MTPLLAQIAQYYIAKYGSGLTDFCFVFPNKRAGVFFEHFLAEASSDASLPLIHPEVMTISDLVADITEQVEASRIEQLFILYRCYREVIRDSSSAGTNDDSIDFNKFQFWGDVLISDFTDVDKYLVDPAELFHNIETLKEISANYLSPEQIEIIKRYWGDDKVPQQVAEFWNHAVHVSDVDNHDSRRSTTAFIKLWQVMNSLYERFNAELTARHLSYQGKMYRDALAVLRSIDPGQLPYERYVFIGFNVLSTVEEEIFETMKAKGVGEFFWDYASPAFADGENRATRFLKNYVTRFPQPADSGEIGRMLSDYPEIEVIGVPSVSGQTKIVGEIIDRLLPAGVNQTDMMSTAIVLPDETLCLPALFSLPEHVTDINVTMGYPMRNTPVAGLLSSVISMQLRSRRLRYEDTFYHEDVVAVLSNPLIRSISSSTCDEIAKMIKERRMFNVPRKLLLSDVYDRLHPLFDLVNDSNSDREVFSYLKRLATWLLDEVYVKYSVKQGADEEDDDVHLTAAGAIEAGFLKHYLASLDELERMRRQHLEDLNVELTDSTVFHLVERLVSGESVSFEGQPLRGLQVMGILETRAIDFDNVIITSMNERVFPRKHFSRSLIPAALRHGYGMATIDHQESLSAYYFYRLISRARKVYLIYDSRTQGLKSGEPSRYINQLRYLYRPAGMKIKSAFYNLHVEDVPQLALPLTDVQREQLARFVSADNPRYISATSINNFINCPIQFTLSYLEGYYDDDDAKDYFDEATFGSVLHQVVERLYTSLQVDNRPVRIDRGVINRLQRDEVIMPEIKKAINVLYLKRSEDDTSPVTGDARIIGRLMCVLVKNMLLHELDEFESFEFISGEQKKKERLRISENLTINFSYTIDRVDRVTLPDGTKVIRIIDYKTGSDKVESKLKHLFESDAQGMRNKAILQLYLYCNAFAQNTPGLGDETLIQPMIYRFRTIGQNLPPEPIRIEGEVVRDYRQFNDEIMSMLDGYLTPLFDSGLNRELTFTCSPDDHVCKYCKFSPICMR